MKPATESPPETSRQPESESPTEERATLSRTLKPSWVWAIALGSAVGWGAFILPADWIGTAGPLGAILGFLIGGALMAIIAVSYGLLIRNFPVSGGEFAYAYVGFGRNHALFCGWFLTLGYTCIVALNASALALLARYVVPQVAKVGYLYSVAGWDVYLGEVLIASLALIIFAVMNIKGTTVSGRMQYIFCLIMIAGAVAIVASVLIHPGSTLSNLNPLFSPDMPPVSAVLAIVAIAPWAYVGFDNVPQAAEEFNFAPSKAFRLIVLAILTAALLYAAMITTTASAMPWTQLVSGNPAWGTADAVSGLIGGIGILLLAVSLTMGISTGLNGFYVAASRLLFAMGRARMIPTAFGKLHSRHRTPYVGVTFVAVICLLAPWFGRAALMWVVDMSSIGVTIAYIYACLVAFKQFDWSAAASVRHGASRVVSAPKKALSLLGGTIGVVFLGLLLVPGSPAALGSESLIALLVWIGFGLAFYLSRRKQNAALTDSELDELVLGQDCPGSGRTAAEPSG